MDTQALGPEGSPVRRILIEGAVGAALGFGGWSFVGPAIIGWWYEPPSKEALSCGSSVKLALSQFVTMQLVSAATGAVAIAVFLFLFRRSRKNAAAKPAT